MPSLTPHLVIRCLGALALALLSLSLAACGGHRASTEIGYVMSSTQVTASMAEARSAPAAARWQSKTLAKGSWTYERAGGSLELPDDFRGACDELHLAWSAAIPLFPDNVTLAAFLRSPVADRSLDPETLEPAQRAAALALRAIDAAYAEVARLANAHGAAASDSWLTD